MPARRLSPLLALVALALSSAPAVAQSPPQKTVTATGSSSIHVRPANRHKNASIAVAVQRAAAQALPAAERNAQRDAAVLAKQLGFQLGEPIAVTEGEASPYGPYGVTEGTFGPGRYCGTIRRSVLRHVNGQRRRVIRSRHVCSFPSFVTSAVTVTYAAS